MLKTKNSHLLNNNTNKFVTRKIWPLLGIHDQEESTVSAVLLPRQTRQLPRGPPCRGALLEAEMDRESFHCAMGSILCVGQYFGLMPLAGVRSEPPGKLAFKIYLLRSAYAVAIMVMLFFMAVTSVGRMIQILRMDNVGGITYATSLAIFYICGFLATVFFMWLAPRWILLQRDWRAMERFLDRDKHQAPRLRWKFSMLTAAMMITALLDYALWVLNVTPPEFWSSASNMTVENAVQRICERSCPYILTICNYNLGIGIFMFSVTGIGFFTRKFTDLFVMLVSEGLAERYKSLNRRVKDTIIAYRRDVDWRYLRESYATLSTLVKTVDNDISPIILLSFVNNVYFICLQLFNGISLQADVLKLICFLVSFAIVLGGTIAVTLLAAQINDVSRNALPDLYNCPGPAYNIEAQRLQQQLSTEQFCLTGMGFFSVTRSFLLAVSSIIVTYEIMLLNATSELTNRNFTK